MTHQPPIASQEIVPTSELRIIALEAAVFDSFEKSEVAIKKINDQIHVVILMLLVALLTILVTVFLENKNSADKVSDKIDQLYEEKYQFQQTEIEYLRDKIASPSSQLVTPKP